MVMLPIGTINVEKAAHRFAGAFLIPADALRVEVGAKRSSFSWSARGFFLSKVLLE